MVFAWYFFGFVLSEFFFTETTTLKPLIKPSSGGQFQNIYTIDQACSVKMTGYSPSSFCVFIYQDEVKFHKSAKGNKANIQPS